MILYKLNNNNLISWWKVEISDGNPSSYLISWGHDIRTRKNISANHNGYTTISPEKAEAEMAALIKFQIERKGYTESIPKAVPDLPMLAQKWENHVGRDPWPNAIFQPKLDGLRCFATKTKMTTRKAEIISSCPHISYILEHLSGEHKLDGELFIGGVDLQTIQSYVHRNRPHRMYKEIEFHVFDYVHNEMPFRERYEVLRKIIKELMIIHADLKEVYNTIPEKLRSRNHLSDGCPIKLVSTTFIDTPTNHPDFLKTLKTYHKDAVEAGYEGAIIRNPNSTYDLNYRSPNLLKYKMRQDAEFEIIDVNEGHEATGIFVCKTKDGGIFEATPSWPADKKRFLLRNKEKYIGKWLTVEFEKYSKDKIPLKPTGKTTRHPSDMELPALRGEKE